MDLFFGTEKSSSSSASAKEHTPSSKALKSSSKPSSSKPSSKSSKKKKITHNEPRPADVGLISLHAAFHPLPPEKNAPVGVGEDPFEETFGPCDEPADAAWELDEEEETGGDDDVDSWAESGYGDSVDEFAAEEDGCGSVSSSPRDDCAFFRRRRLLHESRAMYTGPQLMFEDEDEDDTVCAF